MASRTSIQLCSGGTCVFNGSLEVREAFERELAARGLDQVHVEEAGCFGLCAHGPVAIVQPGPVYYRELTPERAAAIVEQHLVGGVPVEAYRFQPPARSEPGIPGMQEVGFFRKQRLIALANRGILNPDEIDDYIARGGYRALAKALTRVTPEQIVDEIKRSGLRGRGGAGFPTGVKWEICAAAPGNEKYLICNADEGDPGAFMDRSIVESNPHAVLEGILIGARAIGATHGFIYLRNEYPLALKTFRRAMDQAREYGLLGDDILGTGFSFDMTIYRGAGAFVCGEETSLIHSLEGMLPRPTVKPPYPAQSGYLGKPTNINNVETWANVPHIINRGALWFAGIGTEKSKGTKVFSLVGKVKNTGLVEVPMGITLREIIFDIGGGIKNDRTFKAVQMGGPSGGCIPSSLLDTIIDYDSVMKTGAIMGSGGMVVMDETTCMVDVARYFLSFTQDESCGKCTFCRVGTKRMLEILERITQGQGSEEDIEKLEKLAVNVKRGSLCGLGQTAPNPVLTTLRYFRGEYEAHIRDNSCPAGQCKALVTYNIVAENCVGCGVCLKNCPVGAISGEKKAVHVIDQDTCIKCGVCLDKCRFNAVTVNGGKYG